MREVRKKGLEKQRERKQDERMRDWKGTKKTKERGKDEERGREETKSVKD